MRLVIVKTFCHSEMQQEFDSSSTFTNDFDYESDAYQGVDPMPRVVNDQKLKVALGLGFIRPGSYEIAADGSVRSISREVFEIQMILTSSVPRTIVRSNSIIKSGRLVGRTKSVQPVDISREVTTGIRLRPKRILL